VWVKWVVFNPEGLHSVLGPEVFASISEAWMFFILVHEGQRLMEFPLSERRRSWATSSNAESTLPYLKCRIDPLRKC
jgi:hypothetical protein